MSVTYSFRGLMETPDGRTILYYENAPSELGKIALINGYTIQAQMLSTQNFVTSLDRPLYECDIVGIKGENADFLVEYSASKMAFVLNQLNGEKSYFLFDKIDLIAAYKGTLYDERIASTHGEAYMTL